jgi:hypothetical protein
MTTDFVDLHDDGFRIELRAESSEERLNFKFLEDHLFDVVVADGTAHFGERHGGDLASAPV